MKIGKSLIVVVMFSMVLLAGCGDSFNSVTQSCSTVEAGSKINLIDCVSFNKADIKSVRVLDDGNFNIKKTGNYGVSYEFTNIKDKTKIMSFNYNVVDTTNPTVNMAREKVYLKQHDKFSIYDYAKASDNSDTVEIDIEGNVDSEKEGTYNLKVCAVDGSKNRSEQKMLVVIVENRDNCDFRNAKFGDSLETVKRYETADIDVEGKTSDYDSRYIFYVGKVNNLDCEICYMFNGKDQLFKTVYQFSEDHVNNNSYIDDYNNINELLEKKYGKPSKSIKNKDSYAEWCHDEAEAILMGHEAMYSIWNFNEYSITNAIQSDDNYGIDHAVSYESNKYEWPQREKSEF